MNLSESDYEKIIKKLEWTFKNKSNNPVLDKLRERQFLDDDDLRLILKKFEYKYKNNPNSELVIRIMEYLNQNSVE